MPGVLGSLGSIFTKAAPVITGATAGAGLIGNIMNSITRGKQVGQLESAEKKFANMTPEQFAGLVSRAEHPLDASLIQGIQNTVQADLGSRGLAEAPGIFAAQESQALAPYKLQEQQNAINLVMKQLGLPIEYANAVIGALGPNANVSPQLIALMLRNMQQSGGGGGTPIDTSNIGALLELIKSSQMPGLTPTPSTLPSDLGTIGDTASTLPPDWVSV